EGKWWLEMRKVLEDGQLIIPEGHYLVMCVFFFKQKTAYEIGLGIPAEPLFRSRYMHKMRCLLINRRSLLLALRLLWKTPIFPSNSRFPRLCAKCLLKLKRLVSILPMTKSKK